MNLETRYLQSAVKRRLQARAYEQELQSLRGQQKALIRDAVRRLEENQIGKLRQTLEDL